MAIPDQFRADVFMKEFNEKWGGEGKTLPSMLTLMLPNDHGTRERPAAGYPFTESYMADNDLALGRTIEFLSKTPYWKNMMIVVTEDDPQGGVDHVDAHRSLLMVASPYAKKKLRRSPALQFWQHLQDLLARAGYPLPQSVRRHGYRHERPVHQHARLYPLQRHSRRSRTSSIPKKPSTPSTKNSTGKPSPNPKKSTAPKPCRNAGRRMMRICGRRR